MEKYEIEIIVNGYCKSIVPASLVEGKISYLTRDLQPVTTDMGVMESLQFLKAAVGIIEDLEDHLIFIDSYKLDLGKFFYDRSKERYLIAVDEIESVETNRGEPKEGSSNYDMYNANKEDKSISNVIIKLISQIKSNDYIIDIEAEIKKKQPGSRQLLEIIENKLQEAYHCEI